MQFAFVPFLSNFLSINPVMLMSLAFMWSGPHRLMMYAIIIFKAFDNNAIKFDAFPIKFTSLFHYSKKTKNKRIGQASESDLRTQLFL